MSWLSCGKLDISSLLIQKCIMSTRWYRSWSRRAGLLPETCKICAATQSKQNLVNNRQSIHPTAPDVPARSEYDVLNLFMQDCSLMINWHSAWEEVLKIKSPAQIRDFNASISTWFAPTGTLLRYAVYTLPRVPYVRPSGSWSTIRRSRDRPKLIRSVRGVTLIRSVRSLQIQREEQSSWLVFTSFQRADKDTTYCLLLLKALRRSSVDRYDRVVASITIY